ncbi:helix-turn-helix domain-containing protein [Arthrobacter sp. KNU-44]|uniref:helix-turn-helix domain-containing protein n=1 Tax=unclassified Arthrobacter TaxID=235627 RepID=UPI003F41D09C
MDAGVPSREAPLTLRQAAMRAGQDVMSFKALADALNGTAADLRLPGNRGAARYDPVQLRTWLSSRGMPEESPVTVKIRATWDGAKWTICDVERSVSVTGPRLMAAQRSLAERLSDILRIGRDQILFDVVYEAMCPGMLAWMQAESLKIRADELLNEAGQRRVHAIGGLMDEGMTPPEIAEVVGVSYQRIQKILAGAKDAGSKNSGTGHRGPGPTC